MPIRYSATLTAIAALLASGFACQMMARDTEQLDVAAARVPEVLMVIGAWHAQEETVDPITFDRAGAKTHWTRLYVHQRSKESVLVILMCGRPGKMAVHTPEVCYTGAGYELHSQVNACDIKSGRGRLRRRRRRRRKRQSGMLAFALLPFVVPEFHLDQHGRLPRLTRRSPSPRILTR